MNKNIPLFAMILALATLTSAMQKQATAIDLTEMQFLYKQGLHNRKHPQQILEKTIIVQGAHFHYDPDSAYRFAWEITEAIAPLYPLVTENIPKPILNTLVARYIVAHKQKDLPSDLAPNWNIRYHIGLLLETARCELYYSEQEKKEHPKWSKDYWFNERNKDYIVKGWLAHELWNCTIDIVKKQKERKNRSEKSVYIFEQ